MEPSWHWLTSRNLFSTRPYPYDEERSDGLVSEDIDGDRRILSMQFLMPTEPGKSAPTEPRLLVRREPTETGGQYYRLLPEGCIGITTGPDSHPASKEAGLEPIFPVCGGRNLNRQGWFLSHI